VTQKPSLNKAPPTTPSAAATSVKSSSAAAAGAKCGPLPTLEEDEDEEGMVDMVDPATGEYGGPTKGGRQKEPTTYGDWQFKGRCTDF
jgi:hypothetical protein